MSAATELRECLRLSRMGQAEGAESCCRRALSEFPDSVELRIFLSRALLARRDYEQAHSTLSPAVQSGSNRGDLHFNFGLALKGLGRLEEAAYWVQKAVDADPDVWLLKSKLGQIQLMLFKSEEAEANLAAAHRANPSDVPTLVNLAHVNVDLGNLEVAGQLLQQASASGQAPALVAQQQGSLAELKGDYAAARLHFQKAIECDSRLVAARVGLAYAQMELDAANPNLAALRRLSEDPDVEDLDRGLAHYAIAKSLEDLREYAEARAHYDSANEVFLEFQSRIGKRFEQQEYRKRCDTLAEFPNLLPRQLIDEASADSRKPVFVIGMIRSGTTLVEQILGRHPDIAAGGELRFWTSIGAQILQGKGREQDFLKRAVRDYLNLLDKIGSTAGRVVDKMPTNYHLLGLLSELFPHATIIHCKRNALDTAISIYTTKYKGSPDFGHSRANIVAGYLTYLDLMTKFKAQLPEDRLTEIDYEDLVQSPRPNIERLLSRIGVPWDPVCLEPENSDRPVATPSSWQVRQPIYTSSIRRAERFPEWLPDFEPLRGL